MTERKEYGYLEYGRGGREDRGVTVDMIGFVSTRNIRTRAGGMKSFGIPLENVQRTVAAMFPEDFKAEELDETIWVNVALFNNEGFTLADRFDKAVEGKERIRVRITGTATVNEYNGRKSLSVVARNFHILWADTFKGTSIGGGEDGYSYVSGQQLDEKGTALLGVQGFVNRPELRSLPDGRNVLNFSIALNKANGELNYALKSNLQDDPTWVNVAIFDRDNYPVATNAAKVLRQGAAIAGFGFAKLEEYEGKERVSLTLNGYDILKFAPLEEGEEMATVTAGAHDFDDSPFEDSSDTDFDDDDLPF